VQTELQTLFAPDVFGAAELLVAGGGVTDVRVLQSGRVITGIVGGGAPAATRGDAACTSHRVYIRLPGADGRPMQGECSCGQHDPCVHLAAVSIAAAEDARSAADGARSAPLATQSVAPHRVPEHQGDREPADTRMPGAAPRQQLGYVLDRGDAPRAGARHPLRLALRVAHRLQNRARFLTEGACRYTPRSTDGAIDHPRYVDAQDRDILRALNARGGQSHWELHGAVGFDLLQRVIGTGRAHWRSLAGVALRLGDTRRLPFVWQVLADGGQRLACGSAPALEILAALEPVAYLDAASGECGPVASDHPELLRRYWDAPAIHPEEVAEVAAQIDRGEAADFPRPAAISVHRRVRSAPQARLVLAAGPDAALFFVYNGAALDSRALPAGADTVRRVVDGVLYEIERDPETEGQLQMHLAGMLPQGAERAAWLGFMQHSLPRLRDAGWEVIVDAGFPFRIAAAEHWYIDLQAGRRQAWFDLRLGVTVDGKPVNLLPALVRYLRAAAGDAQVQPDVVGDFLWVEQDDGRHLPVALDRIRRIADTLVELFDAEALGDREVLSLPRSHADRLAQFALDPGPPALRSNDPALLALVDELKDFAGIQALEAPPDFRAALRPYQQEGLGWLQFLRRHARGGILADDMGLGKTVQTLAHLALEKAEGRLCRPSLILAPVSVLGNWRQEIHRFAPQLASLTLHGAKRRELFGSMGRADIILTSYPLLQIDREALLAQEFYFVILDEAQTVKNPRSQVAQAARALRARHRLCLTGTPMENHLGDLWSLFDFLQPGLLGDERQFQRHYRTAIEKHGDERRARALRRRITPFLLRRTKDAVAPELPAKMQIVEYIALDEPQRDFYDGIRLTMHRRVREAIRQHGLARSHLTVLDALLKLRQACCDPRLVGSGAAAPAPAAGAQVAIASAKLQWLSASLPELIAQGRRILLFSQFTSMLRLIESEVRALDIPYRMLTGATQNRTALIDEFQTGNVPLLLISLKAGGTGLNLTAADTVIHYDPWWNPAAEMQATDRAHRIGQARRVFVYKLIADGTIEEKIMQLQAGKHGLLTQLYSDKNAAPMQLSAADIDALFDA